MIMYVTEQAVKDMNEIADLVTASLWLNRLLQLSRCFREYLIELRSIFKLCELG